MTLTFPLTSPGPQPLPAPILQKLSSSNRVTPVSIQDGVYHWDHFRADINDPCGVIADLCRINADPCGVVAIPEAIGDAIVANSLNVVKHC